MAGRDGPSLEQLLSKVPAEDRSKIHRLIYGVEQAEMPRATLSADAQKIAEAHNFDIVAHKTGPLVIAEHERAPRVVRIAMIQNSIVLPTTAPVAAQRDAIFARIGRMLDAAAAGGANVVCLQELWPAPFFLSTREKYPWCEFAEDPITGPATKFLQPYAKKYNMVIISPILERDAQHADTVWNTAVVISNTGNVLGKHRKNHIPRVGDFNEATYYDSGNTGHPVFDTVFGKIGINICYGRHHPLNWMMFGLNGAEMVFNPCATVSGLSEAIWPIEGRCAAVAWGYFVGSNNRVGTEMFPNEFTSGDGKPAHKDFGQFYGSSYVASPDGTRTPGLSRNRDGVLITEVDLNLCRQMRDKWMFGITGRYDMYAKSLTRFVGHNYVPQVIRERQGGVADRRCPHSKL
eukprot:PhM_4_TR5729/c0_g1_i1/m.90510/K01431/UPB1, pydC; beta-ureidopropionase